MKKIILSLFIAITLSTIIGCAPANVAPHTLPSGPDSPVPNANKFELTCDDFQNSPNGVINPEEQIAVNGTITIILCSNASTGYTWQENASIADETIIKQVEHNIIGPADGSPPGAPGKESWTFKALKTGKTTISLEYGQNWEGGEKGAWKFNLVVTVK